MKKGVTKRINYLVVVMVFSIIIISFLSCQREINHSGTQTNSEESNKNENVVPQEATKRVYATGLNNPRELKFGPDGYLYVAEGGTGGNISTIGLCDQAAGPPAGPGPYTGSLTGGRISKIDANGVRT